MSNDVEPPIKPAPPAGPAGGESAATVASEPKPALLILAADQELVCVDDLCLPADALEARR